MAEEEIVGFDQFLFLSLCFQKAAANSSECVSKWERVKRVKLDFLKIQSMLIVVSSVLNVFDFFPYCCIFNFHKLYQILLNLEKIFRLKNEFKNVERVKGCDEKKETQP